MNGNKICTIICGSPDGYIDHSFVEGLVICADSGLDHALSAGIVPDIVVGDFDSCTVAVPDGTECIRVSPIKDDTDTILAVDTAVERGCTELRLLCALGGRFDHAFANVQTLSYVRNKGADAVLHGKNEKIRLLTQGQSVSVDRLSGGFVSVFALSEAAIVTEIGMKYPLEKHRLERSFPLGISNEVVDECAEIIVHSGEVIVYEYIG